MTDFNEGDEVFVQGTVSDGPDNDGDYGVRFRWNDGQEQRLTVGGQTMRLSVHEHDRAIVEAAKALRRASLTGAGFNNDLAVLYQAVDVALEAQRPRTAKDVIHEADSRWTGGELDGTRAEAITNALRDAGLLNEAEEGKP